MSFDEPAYLAWAQRHYGKVAYDLASSGMPTAALADLPPRPAVLDDPHAWASLPGAIGDATGVPADEIAPALGTSHAIFLAYQALLSPGDRVLVEHPVYEPLVLVARALGATVDAFPRPRGELSVDAVLSRVTPATRAVVLTNLHNPTGVRAPDDTIAELARRLADVPLIVDEVYAPFDGLLEGDRIPASARGLGPNVIAISSLTKAFGAGPHRVGWVAAPAVVAARVRGAITSTCGLLPVSHAAIARHLLRHVGALAVRSRGLLGDKRARVADFVARRGLDWSGPAEGLFGLVYVEGSRDVREVVEEAARDLGVLVAPGAFFGEPASFRIGWSLPEADLDAALDRLDRLLARLG